MRIYSQTEKVHPNVFISGCQYFPSHVEFFLFGISGKTHPNNIQQGSELNKYRIPMMTVIFNSLKWPIFQRFHYEYHMAWTRMSLAITVSATSSMVYSE